MKGQWIGHYSGMSQGEIVVEVDDLDDCYIGYAYLYDGDLNMPASYAEFRSLSRTSPATVEAAIAPVDPFTQEHTTWEAVKSLYPNVQFGKTAQVNFSWTNEQLTLSWTTDIGTKGEAVLNASRAAADSELSATEMSWREFKQSLDELEYRRFLFRGQKTRKRLRTAFHRSGRVNMFRFLNEDIPSLHRHMSSRTRHVFNIRDSDQLGAFCNLVQHHGYPTPLLDWTYSPFVSAYFAFHRISAAEARGDGSNRVRIFKFDRKSWQADLEIIPKLAVGRRHFSLMEFPAIDNERMAPQQAVSSVTNMDDIEFFIDYHEKKQGKKYLEAIDIPVSERSVVMRDLSVMGITAGSLFPGLDGICEEIKERLFDL